jgi:hypothetical protein
MHTLRGNDIASISPRRSKNESHTVAIEITRLPSLDWSHQTEQLVHDLIKKMKLPRRQFLYLVAGTTAFPAVSRIAVAETYPVRRNGPR